MRIHSHAQMHSPMHSVNANVTANANSHSQPMQPFALPLPLPFDLPPAMPAMSTSMRRSPRASSDSKIDMGATSTHSHYGHENTNSHSMPLMDFGGAENYNESMSMAPQMQNMSYLDTATAFEVDLYHGHPTVMSDANMNYLTSSTPNYADHALTVPEANSQQHTVSGPFGYSSMEYS